MALDPYTTPTTVDLGTGSYSQSAITEGVVRQLAGTKPWVRLISVVMFIGVGFLLLGAVGMFVAGGAMFKKMSEGVAGAGAVTGIAIVYAVIAVLYIYPAVKLWKYANRIGDLVRSSQSADLETALSEQRAFWKFLGVIIVLMLTLYGVIMVVALVGGVIAASKG